LAGGAAATFTLQYYIGSGGSTNVLPVLAAMPMEPGGSATVAGLPAHITRAQFLPDGTFLLNFNSVTNSTYYILYSADLRDWKTSPATVAGTGSAVQWIDYGAPATEAAPKSAKARFYRVVQFP
jgi:hypothetical protein